MGQKNSYILRSIITILTIYLIAIVAPMKLFPSNTLTAQIIALVFVVGIERILVYRSIKKSFQSFENALEILRKLLPARMAETLHFNFDIYKQNEADTAAHNLENAIDEILHEQHKMMTRYKTLNSDLTHYVNAQQILLDITHEMIAINNSSALYDLFLKKAIELVPGAEKGSILLLNEDMQMNFVAARGFDMNKLKSIRLDAHDTFLSLNKKQLRTEPYIINDMYKHNINNLDSKTLHELESATGDNIQSTLTAPVLVDGQIFGMINLDSKKNSSFKPADITSMLFFTSQLGIAIKNRQLIDKTLYLSQYDRLTGIHNRSYFEESFYDYHTKVVRGNQHFVLLLMDLNYLKKINDTFGHIAGDKALRTFVTEIQKDLPEDALLARFGGDEFIAIIPNRNYNEAFQILSASIIRFKDVYMQFNHQAVPIRYSFGLSSSPDESMIMDILVKIADQRMYTHKGITKRDEPHLFDSLIPQDLLEI